jgi:hypothetical protein
VDVWISQSGWFDAAARRALVGLIWIFTLTAGLMIWANHRLSRNGPAARL